MSSAQEAAILNTVIQFSWFEYTMMACGGLVIISTFLTIFFFIVRLLFQYCLEKPGENSIQPFALCKEKNFKGFKESCTWNWLSILFLLEGFSVFLLAMSLSSFAIVASVFSYVNIAVPMTITIVLVGLGVTHSCRERHLSNFIHETEVQEIRFNDYGTMVQAQTTDLPPDPEAPVVEQVVPTDTDLDSQNQSLNIYHDESNFCANCCQLTFGNYFDSLKIGLFKKIIPYIIVLVLFCSIGLCLCIFPVVISTQITRLIEEVNSPSCPIVGVCYTYPLLPEDPSTQMIIKFQTRSSPFSQAYLYYDTQNYSSPFTIPSTSFRFTQFCTTIDHSAYTVEEYKFVHSCDLTNLTPNTTYYYVAVYDYINSTNPVYSPIRKFKTIHNTTSSLRFVAGGDKTDNIQSLELMRYAAQRSPDFFVIGGDIAYANGMSTCYRRWDDYFKQYETVMITPSGYSIPLLTCPGNHEGQSALFNRPKIYAIDYLVYFSHVINQTGYNRNPWSIHKLGSYASIASLDSGVVSSYFEQASFLDSSWNSSDFIQRKKMTVYHAPLYPSVRSYNGVQSTLGRLFWEPLFNQYNVSVSFENHDHMLKRSKLIYAGTWGPSVTNGTIYVGDGAFGTERDAGNTTSQPSYLDTWLTRYHLWDVNVTLTQTSLNAFDENNNILDSFVINQ